MNNKIYIASGLSNYQEVLNVRDSFLEHGITLTYDWAQQWKNALDSGETAEQLSEIALLEYTAVLNCDVLLMLCPGGRGTHFELGVAYSSGKPVVIFCEGKIIAFYLLPGMEVFDCKKTAIDRVIELLKND